MNRSNILAFAIAAALACATTALAQPQPIDLGSLGEDTIVAAISNTGQVVGTSQLPYSGGMANDYHAYSWTNSTGIRDLGTLGGNLSWATAVNNMGQVVGFAYRAGGYRHAFLWTATAGMRDLGTLGGSTSYAEAVNDAGQVVGWALNADNVQRAFLWTSSAGMQDLGTLGGGSASARAINAIGQVVGSSSTPAPPLGDGKPHVFLWSAENGMEDLGSLGGEAVPVAISNAGQVVGYSGTGAFPQNDPNHAFSWTRQRGMIDLNDALGSRYSSAVAVNDAGQVVGTANVSNTESHAFLWSNDSGMTNLGELASLRSSGVAVNANGRIAGSVVVVANGVERVHAYSWTAQGGMLILGDLGSYGSGAAALNDIGQIAGSSAPPSPNQPGIPPSHAVLWNATYEFEGFFPPPPELTSAKAGHKVPVRFSLHGDMGPDIFADGGPVSVAIACEGDPPALFDETAAAGGLSYKKHTDRYTFIWDTDRTWADTCRQLKLRFNDGSEHEANFFFSSH